MPRDILLVLLSVSAMRASAARSPASDPRALRPHGSMQSLLAHQSGNLREIEPDHPAKPIPRNLPIPDTLIIQAIHPVLRELRKDARRPVQRTRAALLRKVRLQISLPLNLRNLPRSAALLQKFVEPWESFALRRVQWAARQFHRVRRVPCRREFIVQIGLGLKLYQMRPIMKAVDAAIGRLNACYKDTNDSTPYVAV